MRKSLYLVMTLTFAMPVVMLACEREQKQQAQSLCTLTYGCYQKLTSLRIEPEMERIRMYLQQLPRTVCDRLQDCCRCRKGE